MKVSVSEGLGAPGDLGTVFAVVRRAQAQGRRTLALTVASASPHHVPGQLSPCLCSGLNLAWALGGAREDRSSPPSRCCRLRHRSGSGVHCARGRTCMSGTLCCPPGGCGQ